MAIMRHDAEPDKHPPERFPLTLETIPTDPQAGWNLDRFTIQRKS